MTWFARRYCTEKMAEEKPRVSEQSYENEAHAPKRKTRRTRAKYVEADKQSDE